MFPIAYIELNSKNPQRTAAFLSDAFGWECAPTGLENDYYYFKNPDVPGSEGGIHYTENLPEFSSTLIYVGVESVSAMLEKLVGLGAVVKKPLTDLGNDMGFYAIVEPPDTCAIGIWARQ